MLEIAINGLLAPIGAITLLWWFSGIVNFCRLHLANPARPLRRYAQAGPGKSFALITGSSAGIGFGIAKQLVSNGFGVILLAHVEEELREAQAILQRQTPDAAVHLIHLNAITATPDDIAAAVQSVSHLPISILVNNVGGMAVADPPFRTLEAWSAAEVDNTVSLSARFMAHMTRLMLPVLQKTTAGTGQRALVLSVSSLGRTGMPYLVMYGAAKSFNSALSAALARELGARPETRHIDSLCILPGDVLSQGNNLGSLPGCLNSDEYGRVVVQKVDAAVRLGYLECSPYWKHALQSWVLDSLPEGIRTKAIVEAGLAKARAFNDHAEKSR